MSIKPEELKPCPFCGSTPEFPEVSEVFGTCYDAGCNECSVATISLQIVDCFDYGESPNREDLHNSWDAQTLKYGDEFLTIARNEAINLWNTRAIPDTHRVVPVELNAAMIAVLENNNGAYQSAQELWNDLLAIIEDKP